MVHLLNGILGIRKFLTNQHVFFALLKRPTANVSRYAMENTTTLIPEIGKLTSVSASGTILKY
jgi:hypothetical protein